jgi:hypothetical protein
MSVQRDGARVCSVGGARPAAAKTPVAPATGDATAAATFKGLPEAPPCELSVQGAAVDAEAARGALPPSAKGAVADRHSVIVNLQNRLVSHAT